MNGMVEIMRNRGGTIAANGIERFFGLYEVFLKPATNTPSRALIDKLGRDYYDISGNCGYETLKKIADIVKRFYDNGDVRNGQCQSYLLCTAKIHQKVASRQLTTR